MLTHTSIQRHIECPVQSNKTRRNTDWKVTIKIVIICWWCVPINTPNCLYINHWHYYQSLVILLDSKSLYKSQMHFPTTVINHEKGGRQNIWTKYNFFLNKFLKYCGRKVKSIKRKFSSIEILPCKCSVCAGIWKQMSKTENKDQWAKT